MWLKLTDNTTYNVIIHLYGQYAMRSPTVLTHGEKISWFPEELSKTMVCYTYNKFETDITLWVDKDTLIAYIHDTTIYKWVTMFSEILSINFGKNYPANI